MENRELQHLEPVVVVPAVPEPEEVMKLYPFLNEPDMAALFKKSVKWVCKHAHEFPGHLLCHNRYHRFRRATVVEWLGGLGVLLDPGQLAYLLQVSKWWVRKHAKHIPGYLKVGGIVRFRPSAIRKWMDGAARW